MVLNAYGLLLKLIDKVSAAFDQREVMTKSKRKVRKLGQVFKRMRETFRIDDITESAAVQSENDFKVTNNIQNIENSTETIAL